MLDTLESIYREHRQGLFTVALSVTGSRDRAEDAVHDAFARLCRGGQGKSMAGDPVAYAYAAVRNAAVDILRKRRELAVDFSERGAGDSIFADAGRFTPAGADALAASAETESEVRQALEELPDEQRQVLVMKTYGGLTFEQIGQALNEPLSTVASRYRRALDRLKHRLRSAV